jgi:hypothetical protein
MNSPHEVYNTTIQRNSLHKLSYIPDDGPVLPKHVVEFTRKHGVSGDSTNNLRIYVELCIVCILSRVYW